MSGSIKVVLTSPRVAPGLLTRTAWQAFDDASEILAASGATAADTPDGGAAVSGTPDGGGADSGTPDAGGADSGTPNAGGAVEGPSGLSDGGDGSGGAAGASGGKGRASALVERPDVVALEASGYVVGRVDGDAVAHWARLTSAASSGARVAWLVGDDGEPRLLRLIADALHGAAEVGPRPEYEVEIVHGSYDVPGARLIDLVRVMDRLRRNCPWDQEQTHESLAKYLLEETYETLEAIDSGDRDHLREELGDLLLQVVFHSRIAEEGHAATEEGDAAAEDGDDVSDEDSGEPFTIDDVAGGIVEKLIRRHPHVFADTRADDAAAVEANWETIKAAEKQRTSVLEGIPLALPALALADKVLGRSAKIHPYEPPTTPDFGEKLLMLVQEARDSGIDAEQALRTATHHLAAQIRTTESGN